MGIFGALYAGVSGVDSQANKIGAISNNISNVNTVGYKQVQATFNTLVVPSGTSTFSPGGVIGQTQNLVSQQGLIQATASPTDVAITGNGFFAVNTKADGTGSLLLTRAGSFTQDSSGNFVNANGFFLQGIPITSPATSVNLNNLKTVSINQGATGTATATSQITIGANFSATEPVLLGAAAVGTMQSTNGTSGVNVGLTGKAIIVGNDIAGTASINNLTRGASFLISSGTGSTTINDTFTYGGFTIGRDVTSALAAGEGDGKNLLLVTPEALGNNAFTSNGSTSSVQVTVANGLDYKVGDTIFIAGATAVNNISAANINGSRVITAISGNTVTFTAGAADTGGVGGTGGGAAATASNRTNAFTGNILNATTINSDFLSSGTNPFTASDFTPQALKFTMTVGNDTPESFTYSSAPDPTSGSFNSLQSLAAAINATSDATARIVNGRIYISAVDANNAVTFQNGDQTGSAGLPGINWTQELDLMNLPANNVTSVHIFNSLNGLATEINTADPANLVAKVNNPNATATITINEANPEQTIQFTDNQNASTPPSPAPAPATGSILAELGVANLTTNGAGDNTTGVLSVVYNPASNQTDMSSGKVTPQFSHDITVFDAQGNSHTIAMNVVKIAVNTWAIELTAVPATDVVSTTNDGQITNGTVTFDGRGLLTQITGGLASTSIPINWTNGAAGSSISLNLGEGTTTGLTQSAAAFGVSAATQDGSPIGQLTGVTIDASGFVIETFSNGQTQKVFQIPLASVNNPNGLESVSGDAFQETLGSGQVNLDIAGQGGTGSITPSSLEQSNVDLSTQLTNLIVAQQAYGANSKLLTVADQLLQELDQIIQ